MKNLKLIFLLFLIPIVANSQTYELVCSSCVDELTINCKGCDISMSNFNGIIMKASDGKDVPLWKPIKVKTRGYRISLTDVFGRVKDVSINQLQSFNKIPDLIDFINDCNCENSNGSTPININGLQDSTSALYDSLLVINDSLQTHRDSIDNLSISMNNLINAIDDSIWYLSSNSDTAIVDELIKTQYIEELSNQVQINRGAFLNVIGADDSELASGDWDANSFVLPNAIGIKNYRTDGLTNTTRLDFLASKNGKNTKDPILEGEYIGRIVWTPEGNGVGAVSSIRGYLSDATNGFGGIEFNTGGLINTAFRIEADSNTSYVPLYVKDSIVAQGNIYMDGGQFHFARNGLERSINWYDDRYVIHEDVNNGIVKNTHVPLVDNTTNQINDARVTTVIIRDAATTGYDNDAATTLPFKALQRNVIYVSEWDDNGNWLASGDAIVNKPLFSWEQPVSGGRIQATWYNDLLKFHQYSEFEGKVKISDLVNLPHFSTQPISPEEFDICYAVNGFGESTLVQYHNPVGANPLGWYDLLGNSYVW